MSISDGVRVNAANSNAAWLSRKIDSDTIGKIDLLETGSASVIDLQQVINDLIVQTYSEVSLGGGATIASDDDQRHQVRRVKSSGGNLTVSSTPFGTSGTWRDGTIIELVGTSDVDFITLTHNDLPYGAILNGDIDLEKYRTLVLRWDSVLVRWIEIGRNK